MTDISLADKFISSIEAHCCWVAAETCSVAAALSETILSISSIALEMCSAPAICRWVNSEILWALPRVSSAFREISAKA